MNQRGQEGASFRLIIEAIMVLFILVIILGVINQVDAWRWKISEQRLFEGFKNALNSPDGSVIFVKDLVLNEGASYSSSAFANSATGLSKECVEIYSDNSNAFNVTDNIVIEIKSVIQTNLYFKCVPGASVGREDECYSFCIVSFGKDFS